MLRTNREAERLRGVIKQFVDRFSTSRYMLRTEIIAGLKCELRKVEDAIKRLESIDSEQSNRKPGSGRVSMGEAERREVSERMKRYWRDKKLAQAGSARVHTASA